MILDQNRRRQWASWGFLALLVAIAAALGFLQYRWIGEVSRAERERLRGSLEASLHRLGQDFNTEITAACASLLPEPAQGPQIPPDAEFAARFLQGREASRNGKLFRGMALAVPEGESLTLRRLDPATHELKRAPWPPEWTDVQDSLEERIAGGPGRGGRGRGRSATETEPALLEIPYFGRGEPGEGPVRDRAWVLVELDLDYVRQTLIPELLQRHLGGGGAQDYQAEVAMRGDPGQVIYRSPGAGKSDLTQKFDASTRLFELRLDVLLRRAGLFRGGGGPREGEMMMRRGGGGPGPGPGAAPPPGFGDRGRWVLYVRHRAGSLEAVIAQTRMRNLAVTTGLLALIVVAGVALVQFTRRAQRLAELQMQFVAGVSHELRTPLSVMRTAGHNLQGGKVSADPARVQRYGALIQDESEKLTAIVEQVLRFANVEAGRAVSRREPVDVALLIDEALAADRKLIEESHCAVEKNVAPDLPPVMGDATMLKHALTNLIGNAAKHGKSGEWLGVSARTAAGGEVEIRVTDRGPGIPEEERNAIFDPFYRGRRAVEDQIHGTGLGLSLSKKIIEAHHGSIRVESAPGQGTEFIVRIPPAETAGAEQKA